MRELLAHAADAVGSGRPLVWCQVVETRGSTPQKPGAVMLVFPDGSQAGTLGGGCIEAEVKQRALGVLSAGGGNTELLTFCLDDDYGWDDGLICGGRMTILADPLPDAAASHYLTTFQQIVASGQGCTEAVILDPSTGAAPGSRFLFDGVGNLVSRRGPGEPPEAVVSGLPDLSRRPGPSAGHGVAYLPVLPRVTLFIVGGGHVGQAVAQLGASVDFDIEVLDDRESYVSAERFPHARERITDDIGKALARIAPTLTPSHFALVITRGHRHDEEALYHLATTRAGYVGMIGSKRKIRLIFEDLIARGIPAEALQRVHAPLGFDIGSQTVPEIAVSIVAELIAARNMGTTVPRQRVRLTPLAERSA